MADFEQRVATALCRAGVGAGDPVAVACSGGPDSTALAWAAMALSRRGRLGPVTLIYVDHRLRPDSAADGAHVARLAARGGAQVRCVTAQVATGRASLEAAARRARYRALEQVASELGLRWVLVGHTGSDQAETVLMRIVRGTGLVGLAGIAPRRDRYARPLLAMTRADVETYLAGRALTSLADPMNRDPAFFRNRVRHALLPALREENRGLDRALCRLAAAAREQGEVLDYAARAALDAAQREGGVLEVASLTAAPAAVAKRALALAVRAAGGGDVEAGHLEALWSLLRRPESGTVSIDLPRVRAVREYGTLFFSCGPGSHPTCEVAVRGPGGPYRVRRWRRGDRMRPDRLKGRSKKLSDLFIDAKVPRALRGAALVVESQGGEIEWAQYLGRAWGCAIEVSLTTPQRVARNRN